MRSTIVAIRVAVEIISEPVAVKNSAGAIMAATVAHIVGVMRDIRYGSPARPAAVPCGPRGGTHQSLRPATHS